MQSPGGASSSDSNPLSGFADYLKKLGGEIGGAIMSNFDGTKIISTMNEMETLAVKIAKQFGQGRENVVAMQAAMGDAAIKVKEMGGSMAAIGEIMEDVSKSLNRNVIIQGDTIEEIFSVTQVTLKTTKELVTGFKDAGFSVSHINKEMQTAVDVARRQGVSAVEVSDQVVKNMSALNRYGFENGVEGLAKMAAQATALRINMKTTLEVADKLFEPEKAIAMAAALQRLGVTQSDLLDPLRLMDLAQNDPAELQNQISEMSKQFVKLNEDGRFTILPGARTQLKEISQEIYGNRDALEKMALSSAELELKMSKIRFPEFADEDTQKMIANLAEMDQATKEFKVTFKDEKGETVTKSITELDETDISKLGEASQPKTLEDLTKQQLTVAEQIRGILESIRNRTGTALAGTDVGEQVKQAALEGYKVVGATLGGEKLQIESLRNSLGSGLTNLFESISKGEGIQGLDTALKNTSTYLQETFNEALENGSNSFKNLSTSTNSVITAFSTLGTAGVDFVKKVTNTFSGSNNGESENVSRPRDFIIPFEQDQLRIYENAIVGGTQLGVANATTPSPTETTQKISGDVNLNINLNAPPGIDINSLSMALNDLSVKQQIVQAVISGMNPNTNPIQTRKEIKKGLLETFNA